MIPLRQRIEPQDPGATEHYYVPADGEDPSDRSETEASTQGGGFMAHIMYVEKNCACRETAD